MDRSNSLFVVRANHEFRPNGIDSEVNNNIDSVNMKKGSVPKSKDLQLVDLSDAEDNDVDLDPYKNYNKTQNRILLSSIVSKGDAITTSQAIELKNLILGSSLAVYCDEWLNQYFEFNPNKSLYYGLVQKKGGPCGILASIQAYLIIEIFFNSKKSSNEQTLANDLLLQNYLAKAICNILWKIGRKSRAVVANQTNSIVMQRNSELSYDGITEYIIINKFDSYDNLYTHVDNCLKNNPRSIGCISFLYCCLLTRGCDRVREDFDDPNTSLIGRHNYCTQEMVNLLLMGRAVSNVFNNDIKCDSLTLHGVSQPSQIGFLSLYEYYKSFEVGSNYKNPQYPIYVILSESHFSVLFSKHRIETRQQFELNYYDGLALQEEEIRLTIKNQMSSANGLKDHSTDDNHLVPLECVIRTKWPNAIIDWNGTIKIL